MQKQISDAFIASQRRCFVKESAVLLITFNRPDTTKEVLKALQTVKPKRLYVFSDGARNPEEEKVCQKVRDIVTEKIGRASCRERV